MKTRMVLRAAVLFVAVLFVWNEVPAQEKKEAKKKSLSEFAKEAMDKTVAEATEPGENHKHLARMVGSWTYTGQYWEDPDASPVEVSGSSENEMILGGRFLQQEIFGTSNGQEFEGFGLTGFDNLTKKLQSVWIDNMSTMMLTMTGTCDPDGNIFTSYGQYKDPKKADVQNFKTVTTIKSKNEIVYQWFNVLPDGSEFKTMELVYKKK